MQPDGRGSKPCAACGHLRSLPCASVSPSVKWRGIAVTMASLQPSVLLGPPPPPPWPCFPCLPNSPLRGSPPFPSSPPTFPARALRETFRGLQQTVRLLGASDVGRVGGGRAGAGRGLGRLRAPRPPTPVLGTRRGKQLVALPAGQATRWANGGRPPLPTSLQGSPCPEQNPTTSSHKGPARPARPLPPASPAPDTCASSLFLQLTSPPQGLCTSCALCLQTFGP